MAFLTSDWHIHSVASYDSRLHMADLVSGAAAAGVTRYGVTDHVNLPGWIHYLKASRELTLQFARPGLHFGIELTTISGYLEAYARAHGTDEGYRHPGTPGVDPIAFPLTADELDGCGVEYVIGAEHWLLNAPRRQNDVVKEMHRQNLFCACSPLVDIVGHPYCMFGTFEDPSGHQVPFDDFSIVPQSMHHELYAALRQHGKMMEINGTYFRPDLPEAFKRAYAEFARGAFEAGVPVTFGSDCHGPLYPDLNAQCEAWLAPAGFRPEDFSAPHFGKRKR